MTKDQIIASLENKNAELKKELQECKTQLLSKYFTDQLTGFGNLYQLRRDVEDIEDRTYICMTIDNFTLINDFYGFLVGDYILEQMILELQKIMPNAIIYRTSGAEFAILLEETMDFYTLKDLLTLLNTKLQNISFEYQENVVFTTVTFASAAGRNYENLFAKVSMALRYAKKMHLQTIAEYVHSSTVASIVKELGIDYSQGYYIDEPRPQLPYM